MNFSTKTSHLRLLFIAALFIGPALSGWAASSKTCDSDGIIGTFILDDEPTGLTITPDNFTTNLRVDVTKRSGAADDASVFQAYLTLKDETPCAGTTVELAFSVQAPSDTKKQCAFKYKWDTDAKLLVLTDGASSTFSIAVDQDALHQATFEVRGESGRYKTIVKEPSGREHVLQEGAAKCFDQATGSTNFVVQVDRPATDTQQIAGKACGVQLEMKENYSATALKIDATACGYDDGMAPTATGPAASTPTDAAAAATTTSADDAAFPVWAIILIAVSAFIVALVVIGLLVLCLIKKRRRNAAAALQDDALMTAKEMEEGIEEPKTARLQVEGPAATGGAPPPSTTSPGGSDGPLAKAQRDKDSMANSGKDRSVSLA